MTTNTEREASRPINRPPRVDMTGGRSGAVTIERHEKPGTNRIHGRLVDLSRGGVKISVDCCIPFDETVTLTAEFPEIHAEFRVLADVLWSRQGDGDTWLIGFCFKPGLPDETVERLSNEGYLERRCNPRYPISCAAEAQWELSDESVPVCIADFSAEGFCIVSPRVGKTGQPFQLELKDSDGKPVRVAARTCWHSNAEDGYLVGAEFLNRNDSHRLWEIAYQATPNQPLRLRVPLTPSRWMVAWFAALIAIIIAYPPLVRLLTQHDSVAAEWPSGAAAAATDGHLEARTRPAAAPQPPPPVASESPTAQTAARPQGRSSVAATQGVQPVASQGSEAKKSWLAYQQQQAKLDKQTRELADQAVQLTRLEVALQQKQAQWARQRRRRQSDIESQRLALRAEQSAWSSKQRERIETTRKARPADLAASLEAAFDLTAPNSPATPTPVEQPQQAVATPPAVSQSTPATAPQFTPTAAPQSTPPAITAEPQLIASSDRIPVSPADSTPPTAAEDATPTTIQGEAPVDVTPARPLTTAQPAAPTDVTPPSAPADVVPPSVVPPSELADETQPSEPANVTPPSAPADVVPSTADATALDVATDTPQPPAVPPAAIATEADRKAALAAFRRGRQQLEMRHYADAVVALQEVVGLEPQDPLAHYLLALAHHENGAQTAADQHIWTGAELEQQDPIANWGRAMQRYQGRPRLWLERARARAKKNLLNR